MGQQRFWKPWSHLTRLNRTTECALTLERFLLTHAWHGRHLDSVMRATKQWNGAVPRVRVTKCGLELMTKEPQLVQIKWILQLARLGNILDSATKETRLWMSAKLHVIIVKI